MAFTYIRPHKSRFLDGQIFLGISRYYPQGVGSTSLDFTCGVSHPPAVMAFICDSSSMHLRSQPKVQKGF